MGSIVAIINGKTFKMDITNERKKSTEDDDKKHTEDEPLQKIPYPKSIIFIVSNEFCERFNFYGMKTILVLYLTLKLNYDPDTATVLYHAFNMCVYFTCILGAILADGFLGKFKTILYLSIVYACGSVIISIGAIENLIKSDDDSYKPMRIITIVGLLCIALGSGGIKPCVSAFGGEQFKLPEQAKQVAQFFSLFYFAVNSGSLISTTVTPLLREDVHCFGEPDCFPLAFGVPGVLMVISIFVFIIGKPLYRIIPASGNMIVKVIKCISDAISVRSKEKKIEPREHWMDYGEKKHGKRLVGETKILLNILKLYLPLPIFWTLFDQQGSRWTFQATRMDGDVGGLFTIKPDQIQVINPLLILLFIPLYETVFYPLLSVIGIRRPLQKLTLGGIFAGIAFVISGVIEIELEKTYAILPKGSEAHLRIFNGMECNFEIKSEIANTTLKSMEMYENLSVTGFVNGLKKLKIELVSENCGNIVDTLEIKQSTQWSIHIRSEWNDTYLYQYKDNTEKSSRGYPIFRFLVNSPDDFEIELRGRGIKQQLNSSFTGLLELTADKYDVYADQDLVGTMSPKLGGVYTYLLTGSKGSMKFQQIIVTNPNSMSMFWLLPQYIVMTLGEVMYSVTGLHFSFSQAPESMKSVLMGCWHLTIAFGNLIVIIIAEADIFERQQFEFFLFAGLMFVDMFLFSILAYYYKPIPLSSLTDDSDEKTIFEEKQESMTVTRL